MNYSPKITFWNLPNHRNDAPLHISSQGTRYSTVTGVAWLDDNSFVAAHRNGLSIGYFNLQSKNPLICQIEIHHMPDKIAAKKITNDLFEIAVSGSWECAASLYHLRISETPSISHIDTIISPDLIFSHGVHYGPDGNLDICFSAGIDPRITLNGESIFLPPPFGPRDLSYCSIRQRYFVVGVSENPKHQSYQGMQTGIWTFTKKREPELIKFFENVHSDSCTLYQYDLYLTDQGSHRIISINLLNGQQKFITSEYIQFPHDISISQGGHVAIANYGNDSILTFSLNRA
jgi:hypothetical protein